MRHIQRVVAAFNVSYLVKYFIVDGVGRVPINFNKKRLIILYNFDTCAFLNTICPINRFIIIIFAGSKNNTA